MRPIYERRKSAGICVTCGKRPPTRDLRCDACRVRHRAYHHERRRIEAQLIEQAPAIDADLADLRRRAWVDGSTPCDDDPVCLALIAAHGPMQLDEIAEVLMRRRLGETDDDAATSPQPVSKKRVHQILDSALAKLRERAPCLAEYLAHRGGPRSAWEQIQELEAVAW